MHILILAVYKIPTGLCKKALRKTRRKRRLRKTRQKQQQEEADGGGARGGEDQMDGDVEEEEGGDSERGMWDDFYGTTGGFWRSPSLKNEGHGF